MILLVLVFALFGAGGLARWHMNNLLEREEMGHHPFALDRTSVSPTNARARRTRLAVGDDGHLSACRCHFRVHWSFTDEMTSCEGFRRMAQSVLVISVFPTNHPELEFCSGCRKNSQGGGFEI